jgi:alpha-beta hydrolase superfamily lysophospholipase
MQNHMLKRELLRKERGIEHLESYWKSFDGTKLYSQTWLPEGKHKGVINLVHGFGEHSSRYNEWAGMLAREGYIVRAFDLRGHGRSEGKRGYARDYKRLLKDLSSFLRDGAELYPYFPAFIYGHSFGGNLVLNYAIQGSINISGIIVTSPWLELKFKPSPLKLLVGNLLKYIFPGAIFKTGLKAEIISRDLRIVHSYRNDKLVHEEISLKLFFQICENGLKALRSIYKINVPLLVMHGNRDELTSCHASQEFVRNAGKKTTYVEWEGGFHELHNDLDKEKVFKTAVEWLDKYI